MLLAVSFTSIICVFLSKMVFSQKGGTFHMANKSIIRYIYISIFSISFSYLNFDILFYTFILSIFCIYKKCLFFYDWKCIFLPLEVHFVI